MIMEYCNGGELFDYIVSKQRLAEKAGTVAAKSRRRQINQCRVGIGPQRPKQELIAND